MSRVNEPGDSTQCLSYSPIWSMFTVVQDLTDKVEVLVLLMSLGRRRGDGAVRRRLLCDWRRRWLAGSGDFRDGRRHRVRTSLSGTGKPRCLR